MGSSQPFEEVTVSADGITVVKRFEEDEFPVPAIAFEFRSARDEPVTVRLRDAVPEGVAVEDLGFHPEYGSEYWTVDDGGISFEREFEAGAEYTTVYGIRATETEDIEQFLVEPTIETVDPPLPDSTGDPEEHAESPEVDVVPGNQDAVKEAIAGEGAVPGLEDEAEDEDEEAGSEVDPESLDLDEPTAEAAGEDETAGAVEETDAGAGDDTEAEAESAAAANTRVMDEGEPDEGAADDEQAEEPEPAIREVATGESADQAADGSLLSTLADEIRNDDVDEEDIELLREVVEASDTVDGSTEARIQQLQRDVADLRAYTDALDEFLDENGTAQQVLEDARDRIDDFDNRLGEFGETVERVEAEAEDATSTARDAEERVGTLRDEVDSVQEHVEDVEEDIDDLEEGLDDVQEDVEDVEADVEDVEEDVEDVEADVEGVQAEVGEVRTDVDDLAAGVDDVRGEVEELQGDMESASGSIGDLEDRAATFEEELEEVKAEVHEGDLEGRIEEMESTLEDLQEWQTQIKETFGGE